MTILQVYNLLLMTEMEVNKFELKNYKHTKKMEKIREALPGKVIAIWNMKDAHVSDKSKGKRPF